MTESVAYQQQYAGTTRELAMSATDDKDLP
jgi:hypothetical protein